MSATALQAAMSGVPRKITAIRAEIAKGRFDIVRQLDSSSEQMFKGLVKNCWTRVGMLWQVYLWRVKEDGGYS